MTAPSRPILRWHGGKWRLAPWVIAHFPPHQVYIEPFGGGASVLLRKPPAQTEIYNDLDGDVVNLFRVIRERPADLASALDLTPYARDEYDTLYGEPRSPVDAARMFVARSFMGMNSKGALQKSGFDTRVNPDGFVSRLNSFLAVSDEMAAVAQRLRGVIVENCDARDLVARYDRSDALIYADPPYLPDQRSGKYYRHEMDTEAHKGLLAVLCRSTAMVVISGYPSSLYDQTLTNWHRVEVDARTDGGAARVEVLWINAAASDALRAQGQLAKQVEMFEVTID